MYIVDVGSLVISFQSNDTIEAKLGIIVKKDFKSIGIRSYNVAYVDYTVLWQSIEELEHSVKRNQFEIFKKESYREYLKKVNKNK